MAGNTNYKNAWQKEHVDRINLTVPKGMKETIQNHAAAHGESVSGFINRAIDETMKYDAIRGKQKQRIDYMVKEQGKAVEEAMREIEVNKALSILEQDVPNIRDLYYKERDKQETDRSNPLPSRHCPVDVIVKDKKKE